MKQLDTTCTSHHQPLQPVFISVGHLLLLLLLHFCLQSSTSSFTETRQRTSKVIGAL